MATDDLVGRTIGQYQVVALAGRGGMARVYKAYQPSLNRYVALKVLPEYLADSDEFLRRFRQEATAAAALRHPNILVIHDIGEIGNLHYIATEYLEGQTLEQLLKQGGALPLPRVVKIVNQLASALEAAHGRGLIHRDVKPSNVFIGAEDHVTLMDFGIVKALDATEITRTGFLVGTPEYISPEQIEGQPLDRRSDLYSLGVVVYQMLAGRAPFSAPTPNAILYAHVNKPPQPPSQLNPAIPRQVEAAVLRGLAKQPDERFSSVAEFATVLEKAARQAEGEQAAALYQDARQALSQGRLGDAQAMLDALRQLSPSYPGLAELANEIARQAQIAREYAEVVKLARQARERAADFAQRVPGHPDPERVLEPPAVAPIRAVAGGRWPTLSVVGLTLVVGGLLGFWTIPGGPNWQWVMGINVLFGNYLGSAAVVPWVALLGTVLAVAVSATATRERYRASARELTLISLVLLGLTFLLTLVVGESMGIDFGGSSGPGLVLGGQALLGVDLARRLRRR